MQTMFTMFNGHIEFLSVLLLLLATTIWSDRHLAAARQTLAGIRVKMDKDEDIST